LQERPILFQFGAVNLRPGLDEPLLRLGQLAPEHLKRVDRKDRRVLLIVGVEVSSMMGLSHLDEHSDDDAEEPRELGHAVPYIVELAIVVSPSMGPTSGEQPFRSYSSKTTSATANGGPLYHDESLAPELNRDDDSSADIRASPATGRSDELPADSEIRVIHCFVGLTTAFQPRRLASLLGRSACRRRLQTLVSRWSAEQAIRTRRGCQSRTKPESLHLRQRGLGSADRLVPTTPSRFS